MRMSKGRALLAFEPKLPLSCTVMEILSRAEPTVPIVSPALLSRPRCAAVLDGTPRQLRLGVSSVPGCQVGVFTVDAIAAGTDMGPYPGLAKAQLPHCTDLSLVWEVSLTLKNARSELRSAFEVLRKRFYCLS